VEDFVPARVGQVYRVVKYRDSAPGSCATILEVAKVQGVYRYFIMLQSGNVDVVYVDPAEDQRMSVFLFRSPIILSKSFI